MIVLADVDLEHVPDPGEDEHRERRPRDAVEPPGHGARHVGAESAQARHEAGERELTTDPDGGREHVEEQANSRRGTGSSTDSDRAQRATEDAEAQRAAPLERAHADQSRPSSSVPERLEHVAGEQGTIVERGRSAPPPSIAAAAWPIADCSSRSCRGGGKYSSSSVTRNTSTPLRGASRAMTSWTSSSGADAPAVTPTMPREIVGQLVGTVDAVDPRRSPTSPASFSSARVLDELAEPMTTMRIASRAPSPSAPTGGSSWRSRGRCARAPDVGEARR